MGGGVLSQLGLGQGSRSGWGGGGGRPRCCAPPHWPGQGGPLRPPCTRRRSLALPAGGGGAGGVGIGLVPPPGGWGDRGFAAPSPDSRCDIPPGAPRLARLGVRRFVGWEASCPGARGGRVPSTLGGAAHRSAAVGPESGRACDVGRARPSQEDNAAAPGRRASGTSTWRPGATRGGTTGQL